MKKISKYYGYIIITALAGYIASIALYLFGYKRIAIMSMKIVSATLLFLIVAITIITLIQTAKDLIQQRNEQKVR